jgi:hypothetical protein
MKIKSESIDPDPDLFLVNTGPIFLKMLEENAGMECIFIFFLKALI